MTEDDLKGLLKQFTIGVMHVKPGDVIVLKADRALTPDELYELWASRKIVEETWPENKVLVSCDSITISIIRDADGSA